MVNYRWITSPVKIFRRLPDRADLCLRRIAGPLKIANQPSSRELLDPLAAKSLSALLSEFVIWSD